MRALGAKARMVFCFAAPAVFGCTAILDLDGINYDEPANTSSSSSSGSGTLGSQFIWGIRVEGTQGIQINGIAAASDGSIWITGRFKGTLTFPDGGANLEMSSILVTAFWARFTAEGKLIAAQMVGTGVGGTSSGDGIAVDSSGNAYIVGTFSQSVTFPKDPAGQNETFASLGESDIFLAKVNSNAVPVAVHKLGDTGAEEATDIALNTAPGAQYELVISGFFSGVFGYPGGALTSSGANDGFVIACKNVGSVSLAIPWASRLGSATATTNEAVTGVAILPYDSVALVGNCGETPILQTVNPLTMVASAGQHVCTGRLEGIKGNVVTDPNKLFSVGDWESGKTGTQEGLGIAHVKIDKMPKLALVGTFQGQLNFCGKETPPADPNASLANGFMSLVNDSDFGDANNLLINLSTSNTLDGANEAITSVAAGEDNEIYISGSIQSGATFEIDAMTKPQITGTDAVFISKLTRSGSTYEMDGGILSGLASSTDIALKKIYYSASDHSILGTGHYTGKLFYSPQKSSANEVVELPEAKLKTAYIVKLNL